MLTSIEPIPINMNMKQKQKIKDLTRLYDWYLKNDNQSRFFYQLCYWLGLITGKELDKAVKKLKYS